MTRLTTSAERKNGRHLLAALTLALTCLTTGAWAAERDGSVLFFSFDDVRQGLAQPSFSELLPTFTLRIQPEEKRQMTPTERSYFWGNGLGIDGPAHPGARMPLWGY